MGPAPDPNPSVPVGCRLGFGAEREEAPEGEDDPDVTALHEWLTADPTCGHDVPVKGRAERSGRGEYQPRPLRRFRIRSPTGPG